MNRRKFFFISLACVFIAIGLQIVSQKQSARGLGLRARFASAAEPDRPALRAEANRFRRQADNFTLTGLGFTAASTGFVIVSARRREPARRSIVVVALVCDLILGSTRT